MTRSLMFIGSSDYDSLFQKGVVDMISERNEGGYFDKVFSIHPLAKKTRKIFIKKNHYLYEFGFDRLWFGSSLKILRYIYSPIYFLIAIKQIRSLIVKNNIDIVRSSDPYWAAIIGYFSTLFFKTKFVISIHADWDKRHELDRIFGAPKIFNSRYIVKILEGYLLRKAYKVICIRKSLFNYVIDQGVDEKNLVYMPHGIRLNQFVNMKYNNHKNKKIILSFVGRISKENYIYDFFKVIQHFYGTKNIKFIIAGDGPELENLKKMSKKYKFEEKYVTFKGFINKNMVARIRGCSTVNIVLMGGFSLIEAAASGNPVVTYDTEWHSEIIINNSTGKLVDEGNIKKLILEINDLIQNKDLATKLGNNAQKEVLKKYDLKNVFKHRAKEYSAILGDVYES